jgi:hypothetical protein
MARKASRYDVIVHRLVQRGGGVCFAVAVGLDDVAPLMRRPLAAPAERAWCSFMDDLIDRPRN